MNFPLENRRLTVPSRSKGFFYACLSAATYGLIPLFTLPVMSKGVGYDSILFYRFGVAALILAILMKMRGLSFKVSLKEIRTLFSLGCLYFGSSLFLIWSYLYMPAGLATTLLFLYPIFVVLIMGLLFKETISWVTCLSILGAVCGVILLYGGENSNVGNLVGLFLIFVSALSYGLYMIVVNKSNVKTMEGIKITFYATGFTALLGLSKTLWAGGIDIVPDLSSVWHLFLLSLIPTVLSCVTLAYAVQEIGPTYTAALGAFEPLTAVLVGIFVFGEPHTWNVFCGISLIIASVIVLVLWGNRKE